MEQKYTVDYVKQRYEVNPANCVILPFWKTFQPNGFCCQWYKSNFTDGINVYNCAEQYMMYKKALLFGDIAIGQQILAETNPANMKNYGRMIKNFDGSVWDQNKFEIVYTGNYLKFSQDPKLKQSLLNTGDSVLVEVSPYDCIWGIGLDALNSRIYNPFKWPKDSKNLLGFILMAVRDNLR